METEELSLKKGQAWTEQQINYLKEKYPFERAEDIAKSIGKTKIAVQKKAFKMGIGKDKIGFHDIRSKACSGENSGNFKGYRRKTTRGYITRHVPGHPLADKCGNVMEHRLVIEKELGTILPKEFDVHHINGKKDDNRIENLAIMTHSAHSILHNKMDGKQKSGTKNPMYIKIDVAKAKEMYDNGYKAREIADYFGVGKTKIYRELRNAI